MDYVVHDICARDLPEAWFMCLRTVRDHGYEYVVERGSFEGQFRKELDVAVIQITQPYILPLIPDVPPGVPAPTTMEYVESYLSYLMSGHKEENEEYTYGYYLEPQIPKVIKMLSDTPATNQAYMTVGEPRCIDMKDPPCLRGIHAKIRWNKLHFIIYFRSWDLWGGFPSNLAALQLLKAHMAKEIGCEDGQLIATSAGLHIYDHAWELAKMVVRD